MIKASYFVAIVVALLPVVSSKVVRHRPTGLLCNFQKSPAVGLYLDGLTFGWIVAPSYRHNDAMQYAYQIRVKEYETDVLVWDSGKVISNQSSNIEYAGANSSIKEASVYTWSVVTWTSPNEKSSVSKTSKFITAQSFHPSKEEWYGTRYIGGKLFHRYGLYRRTFEVPGSRINSAIAYVSAASQDSVLCAYKLYVNGKLVSVGPGRAEAPVMKGDGRYRTNPYNTIDLTTLINTKTNLVAISSVHRPGGTHVIMQLIVKYTAGSNATKIEKMVVGTNSEWLWREADSYYNPRLVDNGGQGIRALGLEYIDSRKETVDWNRKLVLSPTELVKWARAVECKEECTGPSSRLAPEQRHALMAKPVEIQELAFEHKIVHIHENYYYVDFQREFEGGLRLHIARGVAGLVLEITSGELMDSTTHELNNTWGYSFNWTLRDGEQILEQHNYMEFRYLTIRIIDPENSGRLQKLSGENNPESLGMEVGAWTVQYTYYPGDSHFESSNKLLNKIWELCRYTLQAGVLDTYTDSNTRERRPYEADGLIASAARLMIQREYMWARHSHSYIIQNPTWPIEWKQMTTLLAWLDYQATGSTDLFKAYENILFNNTQWSHLDRNKSSSGYGLILTNFTTPGKHIIGWDPAPREKDFKYSDYLFPCNAFAVRGLEILAYLAGRSEVVSKKPKYYKGMAKLLKTSIMRKMWNPEGYFCDGICSDIGNFGGPYSAMYSLYLGLVPASSAPKVWEVLADYTKPGMSNYGAYSSFALQNALTDFGFFPGESGLVEAHGGGDDGSAILQFLTKCDDDSWCAEFDKYNATMTGEAFNNGHGTRSHPWGTAAIPAIIQGVVGIQRHSPGYSVFKVKPRLGSVTTGINFASCRLPTIMGYIDVVVNRTVGKYQYDMMVSIPCNTRASLCIAADSEKHQKLILDGVEVPAVKDGLHVCAENVGCGKGGKVRTLRTSSSAAVS